MTDPGRGPGWQYDGGMNMLEINGTRHEVLLIAGPASPAPIIFLHEGLGSVSMWTQRGLDWPQAVCSATGRAGVVYSRRGYGQSEAVSSLTGKPTGRASRLLPDYMHREAWEVLPVLLQKLQITNPVLLGHSDGATIALLHASRFPVSACIAMAPHVMVEDISVQSIALARAAFESSATGGLRERLARHHADVDGAFWQWNDAWLSPAFRSFDIRTECRTITAPLLLIQGLDDEYGSLLQLDEIAKAVPQPSRLKQLRLAACGHSPQRDQPQKALEAIADFLKNIA